ncbi:hypothetical protein UFOVP276_173 [uncultured Caudovirales phage]|uniref:Uncharacterized protein n=1 Tax=uncultured Caudovirales phage TaxID=2100421 RepID=A0A6J5LQD6_9CAUD|nr:hypothetical protein UFOVP127_67 [uncultured Caudovirales phage]CAB4135217.1 hypothetical protein UFOVP276_173 [uncultured Caudovirales phage]
MELVESAIAKIYKGELVATAQLPSYSFLAPFFPEADKIDLYYFKTIQLKSYIVYEHMAGRALSYYLDGSELLMEKPGEQSRLVTDLKFIHGRSEVMRGRQTVSSVLLAKLRFITPVASVSWQINIPEIYKRYLLLPESEKIST